jgi:Rieske Fe-S protein
VAKNSQTSCVGCDLNRRSLMRIAASSAGLVVIGASISGCGNPTGSAPKGPVSAGNVSDLSEGTLRVMSNVVVARDSGGVYAMSAVCTHAGCLIDAAGPIAEGLRCPCHGSTFDGSGDVTAGPAPVSLQHYAVTIAADGGITVDGSQPVAASTRTPVT